MMLQRVTERGRELCRPWRTVALEEHIAAAVEWLYRAQDANADGGVSHSYLIGKGWMRSYPETTGYIIPTLLNWSATRDDDTARRRALAMADWELRVQRTDGAIPNLTDGSPTVFDTGQVIFGWLAAYGVTGAPAYLQAARKAGNWLLDSRDDDGVWRHTSDSGGPGRVYNVCVAWALAELARIDGGGRYADGVGPFLRWALAQEHEEGWFARNCLSDDSAPLLHTIAYSARGQLECGQRLAVPELVAAARRTAASLARQVATDGRMPGRFARGWKPAARWACLTGMAQISVVWRRLAALADETAAAKAAYLEASRRVNMFLRRTQDRTSRNGGLRGGIRGSYPVSGPYGRYRVLNWATKFFVDALMEELPRKAMPYPY